MWCSKVLVAYDGSAPSAKALHLARSIGAQDESVELVFAHVVKLYGLGTGAETVLLDEAKKVLVEMEQLADEVPNKAHAHLLKGSSPADLLLKCAQDEGCDLIVMGSRGQGGVKGFLGSVSYAVVQGSITVVVHLVAEADYLRMAAVVLFEQSRLQCRPKAENRREHAVLRIAVAI